MGQIALDIKMYVTGVCFSDGDPMMTRLFVMPHKELGSLSWHGHECDFDQAVSYFTAASQYFLNSFGLLRLFGFGMFRDVEEAERWRLFWRATRRPVGGFVLGAYFAGSRHDLIPNSRLIIGFLSPNSTGSGTGIASPPVSPDQSVFNS
jgi:hypothetical protein